MKKLLKYLLIFIVLFIVLFVSYKIYYRELDYYRKDNFYVEFEKRPQKTDKLIGGYKVTEYSDSTITENVVIKYRVLIFDINDSRPKIIDKEYLTTLITPFVYRYDMSDEANIYGPDFYLINNIEGYQYCANRIRGSSKEEGRLFMDNKKCYLVSVSVFETEDYNQYPPPYTGHYDFYDFIESFEILKQKPNQVPSFFSFNIKLGRQAEVNKYTKYDTTDSEYVYSGGEIFSKIDKNKILFMEVEEIVLEDSLKTNFSVIMQEYFEGIKRNKNKKIKYKKGFQYKQYKGIEVMVTETSDLGIVASDITRYLLVKNKFFRWKIAFWEDKANTSVFKYLNSFELK